MARRHRKFEKPNGRPQAKFHALEISWVVGGNHLYMYLSKAKQSWQLVSLDLVAAKQRELALGTTFYTVRLPFSTYS